MANEKNNIKYFKTDKLLIQFNLDTDVYKIRNNVELNLRILTKDEFLALNAVQIKKQKFCELMNIYFRNVEHSWEFNGVKYRKLENFEKKDSDICANYNFSTLPRHVFEQLPHMGSLLLVYHWGRVYYMLFSYGGYEQGILYDTISLKMVQWAKPKNCAPILNEKTNKIA